MFLEPVTVTTITSVATTVIHLLEKTFELKAVGVQSRDLLLTTERIDRDLKQAQLLRGRLGKRIDTDQQPWIDDVLHKAGETLEDVARILEKCRIDHATRNGHVRFDHKVAWVLNDSPSVKEKVHLLEANHRSICAVLCTLNKLSLAQMIGTRANNGPAYFITAAPIAASCDYDKEWDYTTPPPSYATSEIEDMLSWRRFNTKTAPSGHNESKITNPSTTESLSYAASDVEEMLAWRQSKSQYASSGYDER